MKFPTDDDRVVTLRVDQVVAWKCYENSLKLRRPMYALSLLRYKEGSTLDFDMRIGRDDKRPQPVGELEEINLGENKKVKIGGNLDSVIRAELTEVLQRNKVSFAWCANDMVGINPEVIAQQLNIDLRAKPKIQRRRKMAPKKLMVIKEETNKLLSL